MAIVSGIVGALYKQSSPAVSFSSEAATLDSDMRTVLITDQTKIVFLQDKDEFTIYKDSEPLTCDFRIEIGRIVLSEEQTSGTFTISGKYVPLEQIGSVFEYGIDIKNKVDSYQVFGSEWEGKVSSTKGWTASFKRYWIDKDISDLIIADDIIVYKFFVDTENDIFWIGYGLLGSLKEGCKSDKINEEEGNIEGFGKLYFYDNT